MQKTSRLPGYTIRLKPDVKEKFKEIAQSQHRSLQEQSAFVIEEFVRRESQEQKEAA